MAHKIKIKLGDAEFEAEGSEQTVQAQYNQFLAALDKRGQVPSPPAPKTNNSAEQRLLGEPDEALLARVFDVRQDGIVTLRVLPKGDEKEADAFLLILYGYRRLRGKEGILGTLLLWSAELSGISGYRPAQALASYLDRYLIRGGQKKGSTYSLNNQGVAKAQEVATTIFE